MRMTNPAILLPESMTGIQHLLKATRRGGVPARTLALIGLRISQINGCAACVCGHMYEARKADETEERLETVVVWRESPFFSDAERAALRLAEAVTRMPDRSGDAVPDEVWDDAADQYDEKQLAAILVTIGLVNLFNRFNVTLQEDVEHPSWAS